MHTMTTTPHLINGRAVDSDTTEWIDNFNPATQDFLPRVPIATKDEVNEAIQSAHEAYFEWREVPPLERVRVFFHLQALLRENLDVLAEGLTEEQGKTLTDAKGDVLRGLEVVEFATGIPSLLMGETVENVSKKIDTMSFQQPLGVCVGITPFNFPAMIPLWLYPLALACGNTFILKPSELAPTTPLRIAELAYEAGLPEGVLHVLHGNKETVNQLIDDPRVKAVSFVGSAGAGKKVYERATACGKRAQALMGAKNHAVVMPDAHPENSLRAIVGAAFGASGQRCMAISVAVFVGDSSKWIPQLVNYANELKVGPGNQNPDFGPLISFEAKQRVENLLIKEGELLLDGRELKVPGYEKGNFLGPTIVTKVESDMALYREEIFGPVLLVMQVETLSDALKLINSNPYGNGCALFTESGQAAQHFRRHVEVGQVGINIPIPVPLPFFSFTGWRGSLLGDHNAYGKHAVRFFTQTKTVTSRWFGTTNAFKKTPTTFQELR